MTLRHSAGVRRLVRATGIDPRRFAYDRPMPQVVKQIRHHGVTRVLDVGANDGGYARSLRSFGYTGHIVSFEPVNEPFQGARTASARDRAWDVFPYALGPETAEVTIHVAGNAAQSSSILRMRNEHLRSFPESKTVGAQTIMQHQLDELWPDVVKTGDLVFLKLDVQGYERHVLAGAKEAIAGGQIVGLQIEMSLIPLYDGAWLYDEVLAWAREQDFLLERVVPGFSDPDTGAMLQADGVFFRS
jgi:FkbM family methyltransferase